jgi:hypothetical protein
MMFGGFLRMVESSIDFPREDLDPQVWESKGDSYVLRPEIKKQILDYLDKYPNRDIVGAAKEEDGEPVIHIVGSICTNQFTDGTDIDVHVVLDSEDELFEDEEARSEIKKWFDANRESNHAFVGEHPIEVYMQANEKQDMASDGVYQMMTDKWLRGPKVVDTNYDPYEDFSHVFDELQDVVGDADLLMGELKRDVIDYDTIAKAIKHLPEEQKTHVLEKMKAKLEEIEQDIEKLYGERKEMVDIRKRTERTSPEQAMEDAESSKEWDDANALFKFLDRYRYLKIIGDLENVVAKDDEVTDKDVDVIKGIMGVD